MSNAVRKHKEEIVEMSIFEFNQELHDRTLFEDGVAVGIEKGRQEGRQEGREEGIEKGIGLGIHIYREIQSGETDNKRIAELCGCLPGEVEIVREQFGI